MSGAQTTLSLQDRLSGPLQKVIKAMDNTIRVMEQMDSTTQNLDKKSLANARKNIDNASADLNRLSTAMDIVSKTASNTSGNVGGASKAIEKVSKSANDAAKSSENYSRTLQRMKPPSVLERIRNLFRLTGKETEQTTAKQTRFQRALQQLRPSAALERLKTVIKQSGDSADQARNKMDRFNGSMKNGEINAGRLVAGLLGAVGAYKLISSTIRGGFDRLISIDTAQAKLTALGHTGQSVDAIMKDSLVSVRGTAFGLEEAVTTAASAVAAGIKPGQGLERYLSLTGDAAAIAGSSMTEMGAIFNKVSTRGVIQAEELNQLSDRGIPIFQMLAEKMGVVSSEIRKFASDGKIYSDVFLDAIENGFGGAAAIMGESSFAAIIDNISASINRMGANFLNGAGDGQGFFDQVKPLMVDLLHTFQGVEDKVAVVGNIVGQVFMSIYNAVSMVAGAIADNWSWIAPIATVIIAVLGALLTMLGIYYTALGMIKVATLLWAFAQNKVNKAFFTNPIVWILLIIVAVIALVIYAMVAWAEQVSVVIGFIVGSIFWLGTVFFNILLGIANFGIMVAEWFANAWNQSIFMLQIAWIGLNILIRAILDAIGNGALAIAEFFTNAWNDAVYAVKMLFYGMQKFFLTVAQAIASGVEGIVNAVLGGISTAINAATSGLNKLIGLVNNIPGVNISAIGEVDLSVGNKVSTAIKDFSNGLAAPERAARASFGRMDSVGKYMDNVTAPNAPKQVSLDRLNYADPSAAFKKGYDSGSNLSLKASDKLSSTIDKMTGKLKGGNNNDLFNAGEVPGGGFDPTLGNVPGTAPGAANKKAPGAGKSAPGGKKGASNPTGGKLDSIGKINDDVNIADEDLKMLRELADRESVRQITTTLTPTVQFGDVNIREDEDIDRIITKLEKSFEEEISKSAEGVYT